MFFICAAIVGAGIGCVKAQFEAIDSGAVTTPLPDGNDGPICAPPPGTCTEPASDPCASCNQKCSYVGGVGGVTQAACVMLSGTKALYEECGVFREGTKDQTDNCAAGSICLRPSGSEQVTFCFKLCRDSTQCPGYGVACGTRPLFSGGPPTNVCDPPYAKFGDPEFCDPLAEKSCGDNRFCFLVSPDDSSEHSRSVCEFSEGDIRDDGRTCKWARDCFPQYTCVNSQCKPVCKSKTTCDTGSCVALGLEYGYCP